MKPVQWARAASFPNRIEANIAKLLLENSGILVHLKTDDMGGLQPALTFSGGVSLWVPHDDLAEAIRLLNSSCELPSG